MNHPVISTLLFDCKQLHASAWCRSRLPTAACCPLLHADRRFTRVPRVGRTPSRVGVSQLMLVLPRHVLGCLLSGQPAVPPDAATAELTSAEIASSSCYDHVGKALCLLTALCELAFHHKQLRQATLASPDLALALVDAANMCLLAVAGPEADALLLGAASTESVQTALDRAAMVPAALRALAFALTTHGNGSAAAAAAAGGVLDWGAISEAVLEVRSCFLGQPLEALLDVHGQ